MLNESLIKESDKKTFKDPPLCPNMPQHFIGPFLAPGQKFHGNPCCSFCVILMTNKQTNQPNIPSLVQVIK